MPAVTVDDILVLPRISGARPAAAADRPVLGHHGAARVRGRGLPGPPRVRRRGPAALDPFIHMDQMGEVDYAPGEPKGTAWHPHRGFETVTYIIDGTFQHQDSNGGGGLITNGDTQWMTAGGGILHIETPPEELVISGGLFHGFQLWVNLPGAQKMTRRATRTSGPARSRCFSSPDGGALLRVIAGDVAGTAAPASRTRRSPAARHASQPGAQLRLPWRRDFNALATCWRAPAPSAPEQRPVRTGQLAVFGPGDVITFGAASARTAGSRPSTCCARRPADPGAGRRLRPVRDEHQGRAGPGVRGLPGRPPRHASRPSARCPEEPHPGHDVL